MADFPNIEPDLEEIALIANNQVYNSPLTGQAQTAGLTGAKWQCTPTFSNRNGKEARDLRAFLFDQEGVSGRFNYYPASIDNIGTHAGGGVVDGAGQTGKELVTKGWDADQPLLFSAGDYLTVNGEMKMVTADVAVAQDYIEYDETNYMPSPFDPEGWTADGAGDIVNVVAENPSGENFVGLATASSSGSFTPNKYENLPVSVGDNVFFSVIVKASSGVTTGLRFQFRDQNNTQEGNLFINLTTFAFTVTGTGQTVDDVKLSQLNDGYVLIQFTYVAEGDDVDLDGIIQFWEVAADGSSIGLQQAGMAAYMQAAYFGKADDWPAQLRANATIPITPAIRVSPSDENAIEVENPCFPARLDTDDMSRLQVSAPVIYNTTLSIVEDF